MFMSITTTRTDVLPTIVFVYFFLIALMEMWRTGKQRRRDAIHDFHFFPCTSPFRSLARSLRSTHAYVTTDGRTRTDGRDNLSDACEDLEWAPTPTFHSTTAHCIARSREEKEQSRTRNLF